MCVLVSVVETANYLIDLLQVISCHQVLSVPHRNYYSDIWLLVGVMDFLINLMDNKRSFPSDYLIFR